MISIPTESPSAALTESLSNLPKTSIPTELLTASTPASLRNLPQHLLTVKVTVPTPTPQKAQVTRPQHRLHLKVLVLFPQKQAHHLQAWVNLLLQAYLQVQLHPCRRP